jgi:hypothetical protein
MWSKLQAWARDFIRLVRHAMLELGCEEKRGPERKVSAARALGYLWGLTAAAVAVIMVTVLGETDHMLVAELLAGALTALGLRSRAGGDK